MAALVSSEEQVIRNVATLQAYGKRDGRHKTFHDGLIGKGRLFVVALIDTDRSGKRSYAFAPSRFAGYESNSLRKHEMSTTKDGRITNVALERLFRKPLDERGDNASLYAQIDAEFERYCKSFGVKPANVPNRRKYWITSGVVRPSRPPSPSRALTVTDDAVDDLGSDFPNAEIFTGKRYARNTQVRSEVLARAEGRCEYCGRQGFLRANGTRYLESHHIIALANDGADRLSNVIALCANDHREAHFGKERTELEMEMIRVLKRLNRKRK